MYDPSAAHSFGWQLQEAPPGQEDPRTLPNRSAPPPTKEECIGIRKGLDRITKFYTDGASKQEYQMAQVRGEKTAFETADKRIKAQLADLTKFPIDHPRRIQLERELRQEGGIVSRELRVRVEAEEKLQSLYEKRNELVATFTFLERALDAHCTKIGVPAPPASAKPAEKGGACPV